MTTERGEVEFVPSALVVIQKENGSINNRQKLPGKTTKKGSMKNEVHQYETCTSTGPQHLNPDPEVLAPATLLDWAIALGFISERALPVEFTNPPEEHCTGSIGLNDMEGQ